MAVYNDTMFNNECIDKNKNKVYINPNFNRYSNNTSNSAMHVNPKFSHLLPNIKPNNAVKIYVNPNFRKYRSAADDVQTALSKNVSYVQQTTHIESSVSHYIKEQLRIENERLGEPLPLSISRYCLVRQNTTKVNEKPPVDNTKSTRNTIQVNKYKSVPLNDIKRNLNSAKNTLKVPTSTASTSKKCVKSTYNAFKSQFKLQNGTKQPIISEKIRTKTSNALSKKMQLIKLKQKKYKINLKINNIPCPLFRKFGKCLRKMQGKCEFLHDKKHVSICRKFLKGLCHDKACLLSHDLTTKKMPTCYFYLQGTCTKSDCPYLHVKISEKVKVCPDFLKGYCENGDKCLQRHVNTDSRKGKVALMRTPSSLKRKLSKVKVNRIKQNVTEETHTIENSDAIVDKLENKSEFRYYEESKKDIDVTEMCEVIKPMRCKLGTLPAFIQL